MLEYEKKGKKAPSQKLLDSVQYSVKEKYGFIPISVVELLNNVELDTFIGEVFATNDPQIIEEFHDTLTDMILGSISAMEAKYGRTPKSVENFSITSDFRQFIDDTSVVKRVADNGGVAKARGGGFAKKYDYSTFNPALAEFLLKQYFTPGMNILDPFSGRSTRALMANKNKMHYHGFDVSAMTLKINMNKIEELEEDNHPFYDSSYNINYTNGDGTKLEGIEDESYDGIFTCPPYFNIEKYESNDGQLSDHKKYAGFLEQYSQGFERYYEVIKKSDPKNNVYHPFVIVTGNFRTGGFVTDFTRDTREAAEKAGFKLYDEIQHVNNSPFVYLRSRQNEAKKMVAKVHETVSVFLKV